MSTTRRDWLLANQSALDELEAMCPDDDAMGQAMIAALRVKFDPEQKPVEHCPDELPT